MNMRKIATALTVVLLAFLFVSSVEARSGCCSHHGGVCGCGCCDGTSLSATCAPYYPSCGSTPSRVTSTPTPQVDPLNSYLSPKSKTESSADLTKNSQSQSNGGDFASALLSLIGGYWIYHIFKNKK